jgi:hypothetical protein
MFIFQAVSIHNPGAARILDWVTREIYIQTIGIAAISAALDAFLHQSGGFQARENASFRE